MEYISNLTNCQILTVAIVLVVLFVWFYNRREEHFCGSNSTECGFGLKPSSYYGNDNFSTCYAVKKTYLNSDGCEESIGHGDVLLESRFGKLYITLNCNLPYAQGGDFHTMWGAYHAFLKDSKTGQDLYLGSLVRHGDHWYKLNTELLGDYKNYDKIIVLRKTEDYAPVSVLQENL
jgi:hypothetical protein